MSGAAAAGEPAVSLVVTSSDDTETLRDCVASFRRQGPASALEIIVAHGGSDHADSAIRARFPDVRVVRANHAPSVPHLRALGLLSARGRLVGMTEDRCTAGDGWLAAVIDLHARCGDRAIGGAVENAAGDRLVDWAVYFCEYGRYMLPLAAGSCEDVPGLNVSYKREALSDFDDLLRAGTWEPLWHSRLLQRGGTLRRDPRLVVYQRKRFTVIGFVTERYHYARSYAGQRLAGTSRLRRLVYACGTPLLPPLVLFRTMRELLPKRRHRPELLRAAPYLVLFALVWAIGECVGYALGPGTSARHIK